MKMNRRNALLGLGAIATGGGALFGSGAFSQVQADRTVNASIVADNSGAYLGFSINNSNIASFNVNQLELTINSLNENAKTVFDSVFTIDNNGQDGVGVKLTPYDSTDTEITDGSLSFESNANSQDLTAFPTATGDDHNLDADGGTNETVTVGITLDDTVGDPTQISYIQVDADASQYL